MDQELSNFNQTASLLADEKELLSKLGKDLERIRGESYSIFHEKAILDSLISPIKHAEQKFSTYQAPNKFETRNNQNLNSLIEIPSYISKFNKKRIDIENNIGKKFSKFVKDSTLVPASKAGLPIELRSLKTSPVDYISSSKKIKRINKTIISPVINKNLEVKLTKTEDEIEKLKKYFLTTKNKFEREKEKSSKKFKTLSELIELQQQSKDKDMLYSIEQLVQEALDAFKDVVDEADLLQILEEVLMEQPDNTLPNYSLPNYGPLPQSTQHIQPIINIPIKIEGMRDIIKPEVPQRIESNTEKEDKITQVDINEQQINSPSSPKETDINPFIPLLNTALSVHQDTIEGQQTLIFSLLNQLNSMTKDKEVINLPLQIQMKNQSLQCSLDIPEKSEDIILPTPMTPPNEIIPIEEESIVPQDILNLEPKIKEIKIDLQPQPKPYEYITSFGEVVLGGKSIQEPYSIDPTIPITNITRENISSTLRRRASPLFLQQVMRLSPPSKHIPPQLEKEPPILPPITNTAHLENKPIDIPTRIELLDAVNEGITKGVKLALGYLNPDKEPQKKSIVANSNSYFEKSKLHPKTKVQYGVDETQNIRKEITKSKKYKDYLLHTSNTFSLEDSVSLEEEFDLHYSKRNGNEKQEMSSDEEFDFNSSVDVSNDPVRQPLPLFSNFLDQKASKTYALSTLEEANEYQRSRDDDSLSSQDHNIELSDEDIVSYQLERITYCTTSFDSNPESSKETESSFDPRYASSISTNSLTSIDRMYVRRGEIISHEEKSRRKNALKKASHKFHNSASFSRSTSTLDSSDSYLTERKIEDKFSSTESEEGCSSYSFASTSMASISENSFHSSNSSSGNQGHKANSVPLLRLTEKISKRPRWKP